MTKALHEQPDYDWPALIDVADREVYRVAVRSPLDQMQRLSKSLGVSIHLKREDRQPVFSFKLRGAINKMAALSTSARAKGVICSSAGNHAQGVALAAQLHDCRAVVVMPVTTPSIKVDAVRALGAQVRLAGDNYDAAQLHARSISQRENLTFIHPFDDPHVIAGQATIGRELLEQSKHPPDALFIPIGGGGLAAGIALAVRKYWPKTRLIGVEPDESASMRGAIDAGYPIQLDSVGLFADGVAVRQVGDLTFSLCEQLLDDVITVSTDATCAAIRDIYEDSRTVVEPAGALGVAGIRQWVSTHPNSNQSLMAVCCGANLNFDRLRHIAERAAVGERREALFAVHIAEQPGSFRTFCRALGDVGITEFNYRRTTDSVARIFVGVALTDGVAEQSRLMSKIVDAGYEAHDLSDNELAQLHIRHLAGGRSRVAGERLYRCEFPERPGALSAFLDALGNHWDVTLFHYRNHGSDYGRVLVGLTSLDETTDLDDRLGSLGYRYTDETDNPAYQMFLT
ncbi:MAG: threonine ammonia-lyase, biosynthetic [Pseudomonadota bacterium]